MQNGILCYNRIKLANLKAGTALNALINENAMEFLLFAGYRLLRTGPETCPTAGALICINGIGNERFTAFGRTAAFQMGFVFFPEILEGGQDRVRRGLAQTAYSSLK